MRSADSSSDLDASLEDFLEEIGPRHAFETLAGLLPDAAIFAVDAERNIRLWSDGAERVLGFARADVVGRLCLAGIRCRNCMIGCGLSEYGQIDGFALEQYRQDGRVISVRKYAKAFRDAEGRFAGGIEVLVPSGPVFSPPSPLAGLPRDAELFHGIASRDPVMQRAFQTVRNVAETDATVLVRGESGTGKELVARALHAEGHRHQGPFVAVNCAALTPSLIESELFGHKRGAFTGAVADRRGLFEQANGGTLFLDEVAELPLGLQATLLRVLEQRTITPVGASREVPVDVRIVAATHRALRREAARGRFREDLLYRLRVVPIFLPPLRERAGDVELLLRRFVAEFSARGPRRIERIAPEAMRALLGHAWPGNVRELRNAVEYAFAVGRGPELLIAELPTELRDATSRGPLSIDVVPRQRFQDPVTPEAEQIRSALERSHGRIGKAAALLGMSRPTFWRKRKRYGL